MSRYHVAGICVLMACGHAQHTAPPVSQSAPPAQISNSREPPMSSEPQGVLQPGAAKELQSALGQRGYLRSRPSGVLDDATSAALRRFQEDHQLAGTGAPDHETVRLLGLDPQHVFARNQASEHARPDQK